jgi:hypothetical protein
LQDTIIAYCQFLTWLRRSPLVRALSLIETCFANSTNVVDSNLHKITECQNNVLRSDQKGCYTNAAKFNAAVVFCTS